MRAREVIVGLLVLLAASAAAAFWVGSRIDGALSRHGWIALGGGAALTLLLAGGLLALIFHSHRRGYDDDAGHP